MATATQQQARLKSVAENREAHILPKLRRTRDYFWRAAMQRERHLWKAQQLYRMAEAHGREALKLRDQAAHHEPRTKHFQVEVIRLREGL